MDGHFIHLTVLRITSPCKPAPIPCSQCNRRQCCPIPASSCASCAQPPCREISSQRLLLPIHSSQINTTEKRAPLHCVHTSNHPAADLSSTAGWNPLLLSLHPFHWSPRHTPCISPISCSKGFIACQARSYSESIPSSSQDGSFSDPVCMGRERGKPGLATLAAKAQTVQEPVLLSFQQWLMIGLMIDDWKASLDLKVSWPRAQHQIC